MDTTSVLRGLDPEQRRAVTIDAAPLAIVAAAGSGKTTVLTRRIARRITDGSADARHVLALTFTRDAAGELRRRLRRLDVREPIESGTFHAIALRLLRDRALDGAGPPPVIAPDRIRLMREVLTETKVRCEPNAALADLDWARARTIEPTRFYDASRAARRRSSLGADAFTAVAESYAALKRRRGVVDFDDLLVDTLGHIERDRTFADVVRWRFRHLFVDEVQDLNPLQHSVLEAIRGGRPDICLVGDHRQAIYGWNGADPAALIDVERLYPGVTVVALTGNHRCSPQIVRAGAAVLRAAGLDDDTQSRRPENTPVTLVSCIDERDEAVTVARVARDRAERHGAGQVAVLARTNEQLGELGRRLADVGLRTERGVGRSPLERAVADATRCTNRDQLAQWADDVWAADEVDPLRLRVAEEVDRYLTSGDRGGLRAWLDARHPFDDLDDPEPTGAVGLLTFHAAKGREWRCVIVTGVEVGLVPHASAAGARQRAEEARLLYVALTRASDELVITTSARRRDASVAESPWLDAVRATAVHDRAVAPPEPMRRRIPTPDPLAALVAWRTGIARAAGVDDRAVCSNQVLRSLLDDPPATIDEVARRLGLGHSAAERIAPRLLSLLEVSARS